MSGIKTGPATKGLQVFAIPGVCILIAFLGYYSQWLFNSSPDLLPGPLTTRESIIFNSLVATIWYTYYKACTVDPGRYTAITPQSPKSPGQPKPGSPAPAPGPSGTRWCKKCAAPKPPRAHHCRHCARCIPKMDHHCPWTGNCVSLQSFPYFFRFLLYTNLALLTLASHILTRLSVIWTDRHLPSYLGPTLPHLIALTLLSLVCLATLLALSILLFTTAKSWALNTTMIEDFEIERHDAFLSRIDSTTSPFWGPDGEASLLQSQLSRIEFPYDLGFYANLSQAMGTGNFLLWFFPFAGGPEINPAAPGRGPGWEWEENGFNDVSGLWPPPDPEKLRRQQSGWPGAASRVRAETEGDPFYGGGSAEDAKAAFAARQRADMERRQRQQQQQEERWEVLDELEEREYEGEVAWTNAEGDTLWDYGVDEEAEREELIPIGGEEEDEDVPIAELLRRRKVLVREDE